MAGPEPPVALAVCALPSFLFPGSCAHSRPGPPPPAQAWGLPSPCFLPVAPKLGGCRRRSATLSQRALWCQQTGKGGQCWGLLGWEHPAPAGGGREKMRRNPDAGAGEQDRPSGNVCVCPLAQVTQEVPARLQSLLSSIFVFVLLREPSPTRRLKRNSPLSLGSCSLLYG